MNRLSSEVSTYGAWPAGADHPTFVFDRLPSQAPESQARLEQAALPALAGAGFRPVEDAAAANYVVQLGASVNADALLIDDFGGGVCAVRLACRIAGTAISVSGWAGATAASADRSPTQTYLREVVRAGARPAQRPHRL